MKIEIVNMHSECPIRMVFSGFNIYLSLTKAHKLSNALQEAVNFMKSTTKLPTWEIEED